MRNLLNFLLIALFIAQFVVLPNYTLMSQGGKIAVLAFFLNIGIILYCIKNGSWFIPRLAWPLLLLAVLFGISLFSAALPMAGAVMLFTYVNGVAFLILIANSFGINNNFRTVFIWLMVLSTVVAILCLYQYVDWIFNGMRTETLIPYFLPPGGPRVTGALGQANLTALQLVLGMFAYIYFLPNALKKKGWGALRFFYFSGFLVVSTSLFLTGSRSGLLSLFVTFACLLLLINRGYLNVKYKEILISIVILMIGYGISSIQFSELGTTGIHNRSEFPIDARFFLWAASWLMFLDHPFFGIGLNHFKLSLPEYSMPAHDFLGFIEYEVMGYTRWSHNEYLQILAETGIFGFIIIFIFLYLLIQKFKKGLKFSSFEQSRLYFFLLLIPFFVQACFSWTLRHPSLLFLFFMLLGAICSNSKSQNFLNHKIVNLLMLIFAFVSIFVVGHYSLKEYQMTNVKDEIFKNYCDNSLVGEFVADPYWEYYILNNILPSCVEDELVFSDRTRMANLLPYFQNIVAIQGTHGQWFNLGLIYRALGDIPAARQAFLMAVERRPVSERGWRALHALNVEDASAKTGKPLEYFKAEENAWSQSFQDMKKAFSGTNDIESRQRNDRN